MTFGAAMNANLMTLPNFQADFHVYSQAFGGAYISAISSLSNTVWKVTVTGFSGNGYLQLNQVNGTNIVDSSGNPLTGQFYGPTYTIVQNPATLTLYPGFSFQAPNLVPDQTGNVNIPMNNAGSYYLLGNSSNNYINLDASQFPSGSMVYVWSGTGYVTYLSIQTGWVDGSTFNPVPAPSISPNQGFFAVPSASMVLRLTGITGSPTNFSYLLSSQYCTVTEASTNTTVSLADAINLQGWLVAYAWNGTGYTPITGTGNQYATSWQSLVFYDTDPSSPWLTVKFGYAG